MKQLIIIIPARGYRTTVASVHIFKVDSYRYVMSGSLLGVELKDIRSVPVGYMAEKEMFNDGSIFQP